MRAAALAAAVVFAATACGDGGKTIDDVGVTSITAEVSTSEATTATTTAADTTVAATTAPPTTAEAPTTAPPTTAAAPTTVEPTTGPATAAPPMTIASIDLTDVDVCTLLDDDRVKALTADDRDFVDVFGGGDEFGRGCLWQGDIVTGDGGSVYSSALMVSLLPEELPETTAEPCAAVEVALGDGLEGGVQRCFPGDLSPYASFLGEAYGGGVTLVVSVQPLADLTGQEVAELIDEVFAALSS